MDSFLSCFWFFWWVTTSRLGVTQISAVVFDAVSRPVSRLAPFHLPLSFGLQPGLATACAVSHLFRFANHLPVSRHTPVLILSDTRTHSTVQSSTSAATTLAPLIFAPRSIHNPVCGLVLHISKTPLFSKNTRTSASSVRAGGNRQARKGLVSSSGWVFFFVAVASCWVASCWVASCSGRVGMAN